MLLKLFKSNRTPVFFLLPLLVVAAWFPGFQNAAIYSFSFDQFVAPFYRPISSFGNSNLLLSKIVALVMYFIIGFLLVRLNAKYFFIHARTQFPAIIYLLLISGFVMFQRFNPVIFSSFILIFVIDKIFESYKFEGIAYQYFDTALLIALSSLIYFNSIFFIIFIWLGLLLFRQFNWREWTFTIIGFLLPYIFIVGFYYFLNKDIEDLLLTFRSSVTTKYSIIARLNTLGILFGVLGVNFIIASFFMVLKFDTKKIYARKFFLYFLWVFILTIVLYLVIPSFGMESLLIIFIPFTFLISHYFTLVNLNFISRILFTLLIMSIFYTAYLKDILLLVQ